MRSLEQFCQEWILPCIAIKTQEWVTAELMEQEYPGEQFCLQLHGEMLSELIFKQFTIAESRPASAFTLAPERNNQDDARFYTQDILSQETPDKIISEDED